MPKPNDLCTCGATYVNHIGNLGQVFPCWTPSGKARGPRKRRQDVQGWTRNHIPESNHHARAYNVRMQQQPRTDPMYKFGILRWLSQPEPGVDIYRLPLVEGSWERAHVDTRLENLTETLVELLTIYEVESLDDMSKLAPPGIVLPVSNDWDVLHVDYHEDHDGKEEFSAGVLDGDTGSMLVGYGASVLDAVADLARNIDYQTKVHTTGHLGLRAYLDRVHYGLDRRSNEVLMEEMEGILVPEKGGW